jgi:tripartite-type tricarboxylate transporter receptor subunit TctC
VRDTIKPTRRRVLSGTAATLAAPFLARSASAQAWPARPVRVIIPYPPAGGADTVGRIFFSRLSEVWGQQFVIDNRGGAGGTIAEAVAAKAEPDGYTIVLGASGPLAANRSLFTNLGYDPETDLDPIGLFAHFPNIVVASTKLPVNSVAELVAYAKARPKQLHYGSVGVGSSQHLAGVFFEQVTGAELVHVPYRNIAQYGTDLIAGTVPLGFQWFPNVSAAIAGKGAKALAVASDQRLAALPDVPTGAEVGIPAYICSGWIAFLAPHGTPRAIVDRLHAELSAAMADPAVLTRFAELGAQPAGGTPEELSKYIVSETIKWRQITERGGVSMQ